MSIEVVQTMICDGCGSSIDDNTILPVILVDENKNELHFCNHLHIAPYAERRHETRMSAIRANLANNIEEIKANLEDARNRGAENEVAIIEPFLKPAEKALADHDSGLEEEK